MSGTTIDTTYVQAYKNNVELILQQKGSRLRKAVWEDTYQGQSGMAITQVRKSEAVTRISRHSDTPLIGTGHDSRWVFPQFKEWADMIDKLDKIKMLVDPQNAYVQSAAAALGRAMDREIITAALADAKTGNNGGTTTAFDTTNQSVSINVGGASSGLNLAKLRETKRLLRRNEVDMDDELYFIMTSKQMDELLAETQIVSLDYQTKPILEDGDITRFMGFNFIVTELLETDTSGDRLCLAWAKSGMHMGMWGDIETKIDPRVDKSYNVQVYAAAQFGATRVQEGKVVKITCNE